MQHILFKFAWSGLLLGILFACKPSSRSPENNRVTEDIAAKKMLQGVWLNDDEEEPALGLSATRFSIPIAHRSLFISKLFMIR